ncbi:hypothetical protein BD779DRAFT_1478101 [Infundibulicybe gibba]|nr:hypothetical protein BD779DRAFT_1478101 [Infundibulicybe gibba]
MSLPNNSVPQYSEAASRLGFNPILLNADRRKALPKEPSSDGYTGPPSKPLWRTKWGIFWFSALAVIIVAGVIVGGVVGVKVGKGKGDEEVPLSITSTTGLPPGESTSILGEIGQPGSHSIEASTTPRSETFVPVGATPTAGEQPAIFTPVFFTSIPPVSFTSIPPVSFTSIPPVLFTSIPPASPTNIPPGLGGILMQTQHQGAQPAL